MVEVRAFHLIKMRVLNDSNTAVQATPSHEQEVSSGARFEFGKNWRQFLDLLDESRILEAERSLKDMLEVEHLNGKSFLDIGSGSGLFSLAARRLGASVFSFDFDPHSVGCTRELRRRFFPDDRNWTVQEGSVLDRPFLESLGNFDIVYSWGVLHHTGNMWQALDNAQQLVASGGKLFIAIYNDTGSQSTRWRWIKRTYNQLPKFLRIPFTLLVIAPGEAKDIARALMTLKPGTYIRSWNGYKSRRGMSRWRDIIDWVGGYPYEVARPEDLFEFFKARGFKLTKLLCGNVGLGCAEFVFEREETERRKVRYTNGA